MANNRPVDRDDNWLCSCGRRVDRRGIGHAATCTNPEAGPGKADGWRCSMTSNHFAHGAGKRQCPGIWPEALNE